MTKSEYLLLYNQLQNKDLWLKTKKYVMKEYEKDCQKLGSLKCRTITIVIVQILVYFIII